MTKQELVERLISSDAGIDAAKLRRGAIEGSDWERIGNSIGRLNELPLFLDDSGSVTVSEIRSRLRRLKSTHGLAIAFIDYLQLVRPSALGRNVNRNEELSEICRTLKATAKDLEIPIVALAQLNRAVETRQDKRPMLSDLRDCLSGSTLVTNADTGERIAIERHRRERQRFNVWAMDERMRACAPADHGGLGGRSAGRLRRPDDRADGASAAPGVIASAPSWAGPSFAT